MLKILIVEDEPVLAERLKYLIELNPRYQVTGVADDLAGALASVDEWLPDLALVDLQLARGSTGFSVAAKLADLGVPCLFTSGKAPSFPMPDLAMGCLLKPYTEEDLVRALKTAEDMLRGRERLRPSRPSNLHIYSEEPEPTEDKPPFVPMPALASAGRSLKSRLSGWLGS